MIDLWTSRYPNRSLVGRDDLLKLGITRGLPKMPLRYQFVHTPQLAPPGWLFSENDRAVFEPKMRRHLDRSLGVAGAGAAAQGRGRRGETDGCVTLF